jgi:hypothetical protein
MKTVWKPWWWVMALALGLPGCSREQPSAPGLHTLSGPVLLTGNLVDSTGVVQGIRLVTDADGIAVDLLFGDRVIATTLTVRGSYRFTGLGSGGYVARTRLVGTLEDRTPTLTIAGNDVVARDTLRVASAGDIVPVPNPFGTSTTLYFDVPQTEYVEVRILDLAGNLVRTLHAGELLAGLRVMTWSGIDLQGHPVTQPLYWATVVAGDDVRAQLLFR